MGFTTKMSLKVGFFLALFYTTSVLAAPPSSTESLVVTPVNVPLEPINKDEVKKDSPIVVPKIYSMKVESNVTNRFATTVVTSKVKNLDDKAQEATFSVVLPETAYISGFVMEIDGKKYEAYVQEKEEAKKTYDNAVSSGIAAGHVAVNARDSNRFTVSVNIEPQSKATFYLTYEELLKRQNGEYDIVMNLHPGQLVKDLEVQVNINETRPLTFVKAPSLRSGNEISKNDEKLDPKAEIELIGKNSAKVIFKPDIERQKELAKNLETKESDGLAGQFVVQYDVERDPKGGEILVSDGYFVHFFAPSELQPLRKRVVFVLDTSGSMYGTRIAQLKEAMKSILGQLRKEDTFNIVEFNSVVKVWNIPKVEVQYQDHDEQYYWPGSSAPKVNKTEQTLPGSYEVSEENIKQAKKVVEKLEPSGGTNIYSALDIALKLLKENKEKDERQPIIMFLTDGEPTEGEYNTETIVTKISKENSDEVPLFSLSFGQGADRSFLEKLSLKNQGFARHIYEGADASLQLESFYKYISSPLLSKVNFKYVAESVSDVTKTNFPIMFDGSELVVAGRYPTPQAPPVETPDQPIALDPGFAPMVTCLEGFHTHFTPTFENPIGSLEKHWAYLTLKQVLEQRDAADNKTELSKKALDLALKYSFVTPVSSLVVVKPNDTKAEANPEDASRDSPNRFGIPQYLSTPVPSFAYRPNNFAGAGGYAASSVSGFPAPASYPILPPGGFPGQLPQEDPIPIRVESDSGPVPWALPSTVPSILPSFGTTEKPTQEEPVFKESLETFERLKKDLPWLANIFNATNGKLKLSQGEFLFDTSERFSEVLECPNTPLNGTGTCVLLKECPQVYNLLTDEPKYSQYFCAIKEWAGVCCPAKQEELPKKDGKTE